MLKGKVAISNSRFQNAYKWTKNKEHYGHRNDQLNHGGEEITRHWMNVFITEALHHAQEPNTDDDGEDSATIATSRNG